MKKEMKTEARRNNQILRRESYAPVAVPCVAEAKKSEPAGRVTRPVSIDKAAENPAPWCIEVKGVAKSKTMKADVMAGRVRGLGAILAIQAAQVKG